MLLVSLKKHKKNEHRVRVVNPRSDGKVLIPYSDALRYTRRRAPNGLPLARFDSQGRLEFLYEPATVSRRLKQLLVQHSPQVLIEVERFCGLDATPGRAVMPPWPNRDMQAFRPGQPLRPPVRVMAAGAGVL